MLSVMMDDGQGQVLASEPGSALEMTQEATLHDELSRSRKSSKEPSLSAVLEVEEKTEHQQQHHDYHHHQQQQQQDDHASSYSSSSSISLVDPSYIPSSSQMPDRDISSPNLMEMDVIDHTFEARAPGG